MELISEHYLYAFMHDMALHSLIIWSNARLNFIVVYNWWKSFLLGLYGWCNECIRINWCGGMDVEKNVHGIPEDNKKDMLVIVAPSSTAEYHRWPYSRLREQSIPSETEISDSWKEQLHFMASIFQDRAIKLKNWLRQLKWKKILEIFSLSCVILVVWMVFAIPTIFYLTGKTSEVCHVWQG